MYEKIGYVLCIKFLRTSSRSIVKEGYFTSSNVGMEMTVSLKISDLKEWSKIIFKESWVFAELFCFQALPTQLQTSRCPALILNTHTHSSAEYESEIQVSTLDVNKTRKDV
jgi:hypothetical protein